MSFKFVPMVRKIDTKLNLLANHISCRHDPISVDQVVTKAGLPTRVEVPDKSFELTDHW